jgi:hypothetical protein
LWQAVQRESSVLRTLQYCEPPAVLGDVGAVFVVFAAGIPGFADGEPAAPPEFTGVAGVLAAGVLLDTLAEEPASPPDVFGAVTEDSPGEAPSSEPQAAQMAAILKMNATLDVDRRVAEPRCMTQTSSQIEWLQTSDARGTSQAEVQRMRYFFRRLARLLHT